MKVHIDIYSKLVAELKCQHHWLHHYLFWAKVPFFMPTYVIQIIPLMKKFISKRLEENISLKTFLTINFMYLLIKSFQYT